MIQTYLQNRKRLTDLEYKFMAPGGKGQLGSFGSTQLYSKYIANKDLLYSIWNSIQMLCASLDGKRVWGRMDTYICIAESLHFSTETITTFLSVIPQYKIKRLNFEKNRKTMNVK